MSLKYNSPLLPVKCIRSHTDPNKFQLIFEEPLQISRTGNIEKDADLLTELSLRKIEEWIKQNPEQWFWLYDRWK